MLPRGLLGLNEDWMADGVCHPSHEPRHPPGIWFPADGRGVLKAQRLCEVCPVQIECLEYALDHRVDYGVWGGESERSRRRLLRELGHDVSLDFGLGTPQERAELKAESEV